MFHSPFVQFLAQKQTFVERFPSRVRFSNLTDNLSIIVLLIDKGVGRSSLIKNARGYSRFGWEEYLDRGDFNSIGSAARVRRARSVCFHQTDWIPCTCAEYSARGLRTNRARKDKNKRSIFSKRGTGVVSFGFPGNKESLLERCYKDTPRIAMRIYEIQDPLNPSIFARALIAGTARLRCSEGAFRVHNIYGDGNCMFRAISYILWQNEDEHRYLRSMVRFIRV